MYLKLAKLKSWRELPPAMIIDDPGNASEVETGTWRAIKPVLDISKCIKCLICWVYCPDDAIIRLEDDYVKIEYYHCKGCGICSNECPTKAITMTEEGVET